MAVNIYQRTLRVLIKLAEDPDSTRQEKLAASRELAEMLRDKTQTTRSRKKPKASVLG